MVPTQLADRPPFAQVLSGLDLDNTLALAVVLDLEASETHTRDSQLHSVGVAAGKVAAL